MAKKLQPVQIKVVFQGGLAFLVDEESLRESEESLADDIEDDDDEPHNGLIIIKPEHTWENRTLRRILQLHFQECDSMPVVSSDPEAMSSIEKMLAAAFSAGVKFARQRKP